MNTQEPVTLGSYIRTARESKGLSIRGLARDCGVDSGSVLRIERGDYLNPLPETLSRLARTLDLPLSDLFAMADYVVPKELPRFTPYLRAKYPELPPEALADLDQAFGVIAGRYGYDEAGPTVGEDER